MASASIEGMPIWKWVTIYTMIIVIGAFVFPAVWGGVNGLMLGAKLATDPTLQEELEKALGKETLRNIDLHSLQNLPPDKRSELEAILKKRFKEINWLPIHLVVNTITFAILGLVAGLFMLVRYSVLIPVGMLIITARILGADEFKVHSQLLTLFIGFMTQAGVIYLSSFTGSWIRKKTSKKS